MATPDIHDYVNGSDPHQHSSHMEPCMKIRQWPIFLASSFITFFGGIILIVTYRLILQMVYHIRTCCPTRDGQRPQSNLSNWTSGTAPTQSVLVDRKDKMQSSYLSTSYSTVALRKQPSKCTQLWTNIQNRIEAARLSAVRLMSYQWIPGRVFIALSLIMSLVSFGIYSYEAVVWPKEMEKCGHKGRRLRLIDFILNIYFLVHFIVRLIASQDALMFWFEWYSILDCLTVPPTLMGFFLKRSWLGFRFVRIFRLGNLAEVLHNLNLIKSASNLRLCQLCTFFLSIWFAGAGMIHVLENMRTNITGLIPTEVDNQMSYTESLYFTIVTMSTVGYGDITPQTPLGRIFVCLFILFALATFASAIPEIMDMFFRLHKYSGFYQKQEGKSHVVVCGDITTDSVRTFLTDFLHDDRKRSDVEVVFINRSKPDLQLQSLLRRHFLRVKYFQGTVMDHSDLLRVRMDCADACLILASSTTCEPDQTDAANIMRVIAVKNFSPQIRVIVQLLQTENKTYLINSPHWNWDAGDEIVCFSELKLGFLAQSCIAPGFSTLLTNLFSMQSMTGSAGAIKIHNFQNQQYQPQNSSSSSFGPYHASLPEDDKPTRTSFSSTRFRQSRISTPPSNRQSIIIYPVRKKRNKSKWTDRLPSIIGNLFKSSSQATPVTSNQLSVSMLITNATGSDYQNLIGENWFSNYLQGASMEIYSARFSMAFEGMSFAEAAVICRKQLDLLLIAVVARAPGQHDISQNMNEMENSAYYAAGSANDQHNLFFDKTEENEDLAEEDLDFNESQKFTHYYLAISPSLHSQVFICSKTVGFFICDSQENADKVSFYCPSCHDNPAFHKVSRLKPCQCYKIRKRNLKHRITRLGKSRIESWQSKNLTKDPEIRYWNGPTLSRISSELMEVDTPLSNQKPKQHQRTDPTQLLSQKPSLVSVYDTEDQYFDCATSVTHLTIPRNMSQSTHSFDITGMYHYCEPQDFTARLLNSRSSNALRRELINHVLLLILAEDDAPLLGLHSFVMPLRTSNIHTSQLKPIVLLGNHAFLQREWSNVANFPQVFCLPGSPLSRADLRAGRIQYCSICVIVGSRGQIKVDDPYMLDKEVILCTLNIRAMKFPITNRHLSKNSHLLRRRTGAEIPLISELMYDANIRYLDPDDPGGSQIPASWTAPFARGVAFTSSVLDVLASTAYFDRNAMTLIRHLVTGGVTPALEQWLAEGGGLIGNPTTDRVGKSKQQADKAMSSPNPDQDSSMFPDLIETRQRPRMEQLSVLDPRLMANRDDSKHPFESYGDLFCHAIENHGILCLGLFRITPFSCMDMMNTNRCEESKPVQNKPNLSLKLPNTPIGAPQQSHEFTRRLSTCAVPVDWMLRKHSLQANRRSCSMQDLFDTSLPSHAQRHVSIPFPEPNMGASRYVISNPPNEFKLHSSDLVFCLCPFEPD